MKKLLAVSALVILCITACNSDSKESSTTETSTSGTTDSTTVAPTREQEIKDSTTMLDKKLADPNSNYSPDSTK